MLIKTCNEGPHGPLLPFFSILYGTISPNKAYNVKKPAYVCLMNDARRMLVMEGFSEIFTGELGEWFTDRRRRLNAGFVLSVFSFICTFCFSVGKEVAQNCAYTIGGPLTIALFSKSSL